MHAELAYIVNVAEPLANGVCTVQAKDGMGQLEGKRWVRGLSPCYLVGELGGEWLAL